MAGAQCCENPPTLNPSYGVGSVDHNIAGIKTYVVGSAEINKGIILVSDVFGFEAPKLRKLADKVAAAGFHVIVPDYLYGDPFVQGQQSIYDWLKGHTPEKAYEDTQKFITHLKSTGISSIGIAGFCWGAKVVALSTKTKDIQAAVMLHPTFVTVDDIKEIKVPIAILGAENDHVSPPELVKQFEEVLTARPEKDLETSITPAIICHHHTLCAFKINSFVKIFPGVSHGWTVRYNDDDEAAIKKAEESHDDMIQWFTKYVK